VDRYRAAAWELGTPVLEAAMGGGGGGGGGGGADEMGTRGTGFTLEWMLFTDGAAMR